MQWRPPATSRAAPPTGSPPTRPDVAGSQPRGGGVATVVTALLATVLLATAGCAGTSEQQVSSAADRTTSAVSASSTSSTTQPPDCAQLLPPEGQAAQLLMVLVPDPSNAAGPLADGTVGGFGLKGNQRSDVGDAIAAATADAILPASVAVDEEGGTVQRLRFSAGRLPSAEEMAAGTSQAAAGAVAEHAQRMADLGVTMNFAPVADVGSGGGLDSRSLGDDPALVSEFVQALVAANEEGGVLPVVKHWPGIGGTDVDPHDALPTVAPVDELRARDLVPFDDAIAAGAPAVMVAHVAVPGLTPEGVPASISSEAITGELRGREGFEGLVITDSLGMGAVVEVTPQSEAAVAAIAAGADIALLSGVDVVDAAHDRLVAAIEDGELPSEQVETSVRRVLVSKGIEDECFDAVSAYAARARIANEATGDGGTDTTAVDDSVVDSGINDSGTDDTG